MLELRAGRFMGWWLVAAMVVAGCSADDDEDDRSGAGSGLDGSIGGTDGSIGGGTGGTGGAGGTGGTGGGDDMDAGQDPLDEGNACGTGEAEAELTPVNMFVMFDRSGSMDDDNKWVDASAALSSFFANPASADLRVALRFFPHNSPATGCHQNGCDAVACSQPLVDIGELGADAAPTDTHEEALLDAITASAPGSGGGTPMYAALDGALRWATAHKATTPDENTVVILVTDGEPNGCDEDINNIAALASTALASSGVTTYAIGLVGSSEAQMNQIAAAGGTTMGIFIGSGNAEQDLLDALNAIRGQNLSCDFAMPTPTDDTMEVDPKRINVTYTPGSGSAVTFPQVASEPDCAASSAWYYDDPQAPTRIHLCPAACDTVRADSNPQLKILIGCSTCGGLDMDCGEGTPPDLPPIIID